MRFFCTCECKKTQEASENALREVRGLRADLDDLWDRFTRLQGRLAKRGDLTPAQPERAAVDGDEANGGHAGNPVAIAMLRKRGRL